MKESFWGFNRAAKVNLQADQNFLLFCFCWIFLKQRLTCCSFRFIFIFTFLSFSTFSVLTAKTWNNNLAYCLRDKSGEQYYWAQNIHDEKRINIAFWQHTLMKAFENHNSCRLKKKKKKCSCRYSVSPRKSWAPLGTASDSGSWRHTAIWLLSHTATWCFTVLRKRIKIILKALFCL